ncbi:hypothetical protein KY285_022501 [Solanum tuberosum]|nr:hypothetical protein KY285_022501 [Solanum tuberosum]
MVDFEAFHQRNFDLTCKCHTKSNFQLPISSSVIVTLSYKRVRLSFVAQSTTYIERFHDFMFLAGLLDMLQFHRLIVKWPVLPMCSQMGNEH